MTTIKYFGANSLAKLISLIKGMKVSDFTNDAGYITSSSVPTKVSDLTNDSGFVTSSDVPTKVSDLTNDSGFITSSDIPAIPTKTSDLTNDSGFITSASIPTVPTDVSDLNNDAGYITSADLSSYFPKAGGEIAGRTVIDLPTAGVVDTPGEQPSLVLSANDLTLGTAPADERWWGVYLTDHTQDSGYGGRIAAFETHVLADGTVAANVTAERFITGKNSWEQSVLKAIIEPDGTKYGTAPTPVAGDSSSKIATTAWVHREYLPLAGGTMTGGIVRNGTLAVGSADSASISIHGGTAYANGGAVVAYGKTNSGSPGWVRLHAQDATNSTDVILKPDGTFTVGGTDISLSGHTHAYLPTAGGTMSGAIKRSGDFVTNTADTSWIRLNGGTSYTNGAYVCIYGKSHGTNAGQVIIRTNNGSTTNDFYLRPNGTMSWGGNTIAYGVGSYSQTNIVATGYLTSSNKQVTLSLPIIVNGSSFTVTALSGSIRGGTGGYLSPGGSSGEDLLTGATCSCTIRSHFVNINLTRSAGWGGVNNGVYSAVLSIRFTVA